MPKFSKADISRPDFNALLYGGIQVYHDTKILDQDLIWYENEGYKIFTHTCLDWDDFLFFIADSFGENEDDRYLFDLPFLLERYHEEAPDNEIGMVICLKSFELLQKDLKKYFSKGVLYDEIRNHARIGMLFGKRYVVLIQTNDLNIDLPKPTEVSFYPSNNIWNLTERDLFSIANDELFEAKPLISLANASWEDVENFLKNQNHQKSLDKTPKNNGTKTKKPLDKTPKNNGTKTKKSLDKTPKNNGTKTQK